MTGSLLVDWTIIAVVCGVIAAFFCSRSPLIGFVLGALFGPLGLVLAAQVNTQMAVAELKEEIFRKSVQGQSTPPFTGTA